MRSASPAVPTRCNGDQRADGKPVDAAGSNTANSPLSARAATVTSYRSRFTDTTTAGPSHVATADAANAVLPDPVGPIKATDPLDPCRTAALPDNALRSRSSVARTRPDPA